MASKVIIISSSPPLPESRLRPCSPSPTPPMDAKKPSKTGSRAAPIPEGVHSGFRSANAVLKEAGLGDDLVDAAGIQRSRKDDSEKENIGHRHGAKSSRKEQRVAGIVQADTEDTPTVAILKPQPKQRRSKPSEIAKLKLEKRPAVRKAKTSADTTTEVDRNLGTSHVSTETEDTQPGGSLAPIAKRRQSSKKTFRLPGAPPMVEAAQVCVRPVGASPRTMENDLDAANHTAITAIARRRSWTPPVDTAATVIVPGNAVNKSEAARDQPGFVMIDLQGCFGFVDKDNEGATSVFPARADAGEPLAKRQRLEVTKSVARLPPEAAAPKKPKSPKKPLTITAQAIATDRGDNVNEGPATVSGGLPTFGFQVATKGTCTAKVKLNDVEDDEPKKKRTSRAKAKSTAETPLPLPSPKAAIMRIARQDWLFGTSSQIKRDDDPDFLRDLQQALEESEGSCVPSVPVIAAGHTSFLRRGNFASAERNLWASATRGEDTLMLLPEDPEERRRFRDIVAAAQDENPAAIVEDDSTHNIDQVGTTKLEYQGEVPREPHDNTTDPLHMDATETDMPTLTLFQGGDEMQPKALAKRPRVIRLAPTAKSKPAFCFVGNRSQSPSKNSLATSRPTSPLSCQGLPVNVACQGVAALHTAAILSTRDVPGRVGSIEKALIAQPEAESQTIEQRQVTEKPPNVRKTKAKQDGKPAEEVIKAGKAKLDAKDPNAPKRPRGRPRKDQGAASAAGPAKPAKKSKQSKSESEPADNEWPCIDEIEDDTAPSPSPSRRKALTPPGQLEISIGNPKEPKSKKGKKSPDPTILDALAAARKELFPKITHLVKSQPRSQNPASLSWFEKILLYDPIILDDFTEWLNTQGLRMPDVLLVARMSNCKKYASGDSEEHACLLTPLVVQRWCEENSICATWRESMWDRSRKRRRGGHNVEEEGV